MLIETAYAKAATLSFNQLRDYLNKCDRAIVFQHKMAKRRSEAPARRIIRPLERYRAEFSRQLMIRFGYGSVAQQVDASR